MNSAQCSSSKVRSFLFDETAKQIRRRVGAVKQDRFRPHNRVRGRADKQIISYYQSVLKTGIIKFTTPSGTTPGYFWNQQIKLLDLKKLKKAHQNWTPRQLVLAALKGNIQVHCNCPAFLYWGYMYIAWQKGWGLKRQTIAPDVRNPKRKGAVCKHLDAVLKVLPFNSAKILKDLKAKKAI